jgi:hypothetical protein
MVGGNAPLDGAARPLDDQRADRGSYTPFGVLVLSGTFALVLLVLMWAGALANILLHVLWIDAPKWLSAACYIALGWIGVVALPDLKAHAGWGPAALLMAGGVIYSLGALVYALRRPDPVPAVFGYHEVFHASWWSPRASTTPRSRRSSCSGSTVQRRRTTLRPDSRRAGGPV